MSVPAENTWLEQNRQYLDLAVRSVKAELKQYQQGTTTADPETEMTRLEAEMTTPPALNRIAELFGLSAFEKKMLLLCAAVELDAGVAGLVQTLMGGSVKAPSFSLALSVFGEAHWSAVTPEAPLRYWKILEPGGSDLSTHAPCYLDEQILHYLTGIRYMPQKLQYATSAVEPDTAAAGPYNDAMAALVQFCAADNNALVQLRGGETTDRAVLTASALHPYQYPVYVLNPHFLPAGLQEVAEWVRLWSRTAALHNLALFIDGSQWDSLDPQQKKQVSYLLDHIQGIVVLGIDQKPTGLNRDIQTIDIEALSPEAQQQVWQHHLGELADTLNGELGQITAQFNLGSGAIKKLSQQVEKSGSRNGILNETGIKDRIWKACKEYTRPELELLAQRIEPFARWDDLVLPEAQKNILRDISVHVRQRNKVYGDWGFAGKSRRGLGITALFSGESGTGKTMASEVIANELQLDLYRIDLSQVVNKYIGETEKNLKRIFDAAEGSGAILLFDEADALFGKRSEVKDSHDRYSNIEVSYLLQKMEEYRGLAILTTNMKNALDKAFLRRIRFIVPFPFPDSEMRAEIWKRIFPRKTPLEGLDYQRLSALNIAGGNIRNIALNASFSAAGMQRSVTMNDIQQAARNEYQKLEKHMSSGESIV